MEHHRGSADHHDELHLWGHLDLRLVLVVELLKDSIIVLDILHRILGPTVELQVEGVELVVQKLQAGHAGDEHAALELDGALDLDAIGHPLILGSNLLNVAVDCQALARCDTLLVQTRDLVQQVRLFVLDGRIALRGPAVAAALVATLLTLRRPVVLLVLLAAVKLLGHGRGWGRTLPRVHEHIQALVRGHLGLDRSRGPLGERTGTGRLGLQGNRLLLRGRKRNLIQQLRFVVIHRKSLTLIRVKRKLHLPVL